MNLRKIAGLGNRWEEFFKKKRRGMNLQKAIHTTVENEDIVHCEKNMLGSVSARKYEEKTMCFFVSRKMLMLIGFSPIFRNPTLESAGCSLSALPT